MLFYDYMAIYYYNMLNFIILPFLVIFNTSQLPM